MSRSTASRKIRSATGAKQAARELLAEQTAINNLAAAIGMPAAQSRSADVTADIIPIGRAGRASSDTLRKLTPVEKLVRSKLIDENEAAACEWYATTYTLAFEVGHGGVGNYSGMPRGGNKGSAEERMMTRYRGQAEARADYAWARNFLPADHAPLFEAIVCRNTRIGDAGRQIWADESASGVSTKTRAAFRLCVSHLMIGIGHRLNIAPVMKPAPAGAPPVPTLAPTMTPGRPASEAIDEALGKAEAEGATGLWLSPSVLAALERENGADGMISYRGLALEVQPHWSWAWIVIKPDGSASSHRP